MPRALHQHDTDKHSAKPDVREPAPAGDGELQALADASPRVASLHALQRLADASPRVASLHALQRLADRRGPAPTDPKRQQAIARAGVLGPGTPYPHRDTIQAAFGRHRIDGVVAHTDHLARSASSQLEARGYAIGEHVGFASERPDLFAATHEAVHYVQKQRGGVGSPAAAGGEGDPHERQANALARDVVEGYSVERALDRTPAGSRAGDGGDSVQRLGEVEALNNTKGLSIRTANRRASVTATSGEVYAKFEFIIHSLWQNEGFLDTILAAIRRAHPNLTSDADATNWGKANNMHLNRFVAEELKAARCLSYAQVVASRIIQSTQNQWVYVVGVDYTAGFGADHGWVVTSPNQLRRGENNHLSNDYTQAELDDIMIADAWDSFKAMSLGRYLRAQHNYFGADVRTDQVKIIESGQALGAQAFAQRFPQTLIRSIKNAASSTLREHKRDNRNSYDGDKEYASKDKVVWDFARDKSHVNLEHDDAARLWSYANNLGRGNRNRAYLAWAGDARGRRMDWQHEHARAAFHYLITTNALAQQARQLITDLDHTSPLPASIDGNDLWRYVQQERLTGSQTQTQQRRQALVRAMSTQQHREMQARAGRKTFTREVFPLLTQTQQQAL
ncbi:DUF4157 domain-containing protein [Pseudenhygromyxa sp. WMMC2535]|uniref:eCIS core domain-containing protein n=1 Tax=Pseudenhygromyxa sp. WMMC2535 TaxID=2712867 RepID=UPI001557ECA3|nr:DUF4157 domain-containing protein [Pseudenhygromyxa sp. WMMC2535]NVB37476.1 DUF4157 domain-containing protein [Pseudenhygromyxa sp. WMMC2535]